MALSQRRAQVVARLRQRKTREREGLVLVEGIRAASEALSARAEAVFAVTSPRLAELDRDGGLRSDLARAGVDVSDVEDGELTRLGDTEHPQGILLVCRQPRVPAGMVRAGARLLILDGVQDPGNVGTLLRGATAFALDGVVVLDGTADPWGAKTVRSSAGMGFRIPVLQATAPEALDLLQAAEVPVVVADAGGRDVGRYAPGAGWALVVGNEGAGPRAELREAAAVTVRIPMPGGAESLNAGVAGSILMYALTRENAGAS